MFMREGYIDWQSNLWDIVCSVCGEGKHCSNSDTETLFMAHHHCISLEY